jgi:beta-lactamase regulating signal transducer with metallopeptidase domain
MIPFLLKSALVLAIVFVLYKVLLEREKMPRFKRFYLLVGLAVAFVLPLLTIPIYVEVEAPAPQPAFTTIKMPASQISEAVTTQPEAHIVSQTIPRKCVRVVEIINYLPYVLWVIYGLVTVLLAIRFTVNIVHFYRKAKRNKRVALQGATVVLLNDCPLPYTFMNFIFVNEADYEGKAIETELLTHELAHVRQRHTLDVLFVELLKAVFWFNLYYTSTKKPYKPTMSSWPTKLCYPNTIIFPPINCLLGKATPPLAYAWPAV